MNKKPGLLATLRTYSEWFIPVGAVALVFVMLVPLPSFFLDLLLTLSITASVLVLLTAIQVLRPVEFSVFPSLILLLTLMRLSLDLAATRRILLHGSEGSSAAGKVIEAFGQFVVGGNYIVGFVIFIALIAIQYLVVSHGAVRTAEVTARFTLDAMPGKQMAIDSDLNTGLINADQARQRREAGGPRSGVLRLDGRRRSLQPARLVGYHSGHRNQHHRRLPDRRISAGSAVPRGAQDLHNSHRRRRPGGDHSVVAGFGSRWHRRHPRRIRPIARCGYRQADVPDRASAVDRERVLLSLALIPGMPKISFIALGGVTMFAAWKMKPAAAAEAAIGAKAAAMKATSPARRQLIRWMRFSSSTS